MRKIFIVITAVAVAWGSSIGAAHAFVGTVAGNGTIKYVYNPSNSPDSGTCGNDWANDTNKRTYKVFSDQAIDGSYRVRVLFKNGTFTTIAGQSPESCEAGNGNTVAGGITGTYGGSITMKVSNTDGTWTPSKDVNCASSDCFLTEFVAAAFGGSATFSVSDFYFKYITTDSGACLKQWVNSGTGNSGDIASVCS